MRRRHRAEAIRPGDASAERSLASRSEKAWDNRFPAGAMRGNDGILGSGRQIDAQARHEAQDPCARPLTRTAGELGMSESAGRTGPEDADPSEPDAEAGAGRRPLPEWHEPPGDPLASLTERAMLLGGE
jgi:hypothetical protein